MSNKANTGRKIVLLQSNKSRRYGDLVYAPSKSAHKTIIFEKI